MSEQPSHAPVNIASCLVEMAGRQPDTDALLTSPRRDSAGKLSYTHTTFRQLNELSDAYARGFASLHLSAGTRIALLLKPGVNFFAVTFALFKLGAIPVLIDPGIGLKNFGRCLGQAQPAALIGTPLAHLLRRALGWGRKTIHTTITTHRFGGHSLHALAARHANGAPPTPARNPEAAILFTSGSTGPAKGVLYTHANFAAQIQALKQMYDIQPGEIDLATFPLFALFGPALGMTTVLPDMNFTRPGFVHPPHILEPIRQLNITNMFGSPALIHRVGEYGRQHHVKLPSLRRVISAGAPASAPSLERFAAMLNPDTQIFTPYGATESLPVSSIGSHQILGETTLQTNQGHGVCVGTPAPNIRVRIIRISDAPIEKWSEDLELPPGGIGEIVVQGPVVTSGYFQRPDATALAKIQDGASFYHRMGDCGYLDERGRLWFVGRKSQRVRLAGGDLFSTPVESIFNTLPGVSRSALVGIVRHGTTLPVICIEWARGSTERFTREAFLQLAERYPHTRMIRDYLVHPGFPVDIRHNAKINRELLTRWAQRKLA